MERHPYGCGKYLANLAINSAVGSISNIISSLVYGLIMRLFFSTGGKKTSSIIEYVSRFSNKPILYLEIFNICICAPIVEELIWRKLLIDRLALYSKRLAIFGSGILFGIGHFNIHQLFSAMFLGWSFAYAYAETNNIFIPISFHMFENSYATLINLFLLKKEILSVIGLLRIIIFLIGVCLLIRNRNSIIIRGEENNFEDKWVLFKSYGMKCFIIEGIIIIIYNTIRTKERVPNNFQQNLK